MGLILFRWITNRPQCWCFGCGIGSAPLDVAIVLLCYLFVTL